MAKKVISIILISIAFVATVVVGVYFLTGVISIITDLPKCIAQAEDTSAINSCNASFAAGIVLMAMFAVVIELPVMGGATLLSIIATILNRKREDFKWDFRMVFMVICCILPAIIAATTFVLIQLNPSN